MATVMGYIELTELMWALIKQLGSQNKLAKALRQSRPQITYWLNGDRKPRYEHILAMQKLLKKLAVSQSHKNKQSFKHKHDLEALDTTASLTISERVALVKRYEKLLSIRKGPRNIQKRTDKNLLLFQDSDLNRLSLDDLDQNLALEKINARLQSPLFQGRTDDLLAKQIGLGKDTYRAAKIVIEKGIPELICAMDKKAIGVHAAKDIAKFPVEMQKELLEKCPKEILHFLKKKTISTLTKNSISVTKAHAHLPISFIETLQEIHNSLLLKKIEAEDHLPARAFFLGVLSECDSKGKFLYDLELLKEKIMPYLNFDVEQLMNKLCAYKLIKKSQVRSAESWQILWKIFEKDAELKIRSSETKNKIINQ